jgi:outer membrane lipoprotein SlyB
MKNSAKLFVPMAILAATSVMPDGAYARKRHHTVYHSRATRCSGGNGAVGTVGGGVGGALIGHEVIGGPVATIAGGVGGALLGRHLDKQHTRRRQGCR